MVLVDAGFSRTLVAKTSARSAGHCGTLELIRAAWREEPCRDLDAWAASFRADLASFGSNAFPQKEVVLLIPGAATLTRVIAGSASAEGGGSARRAAAEVAAALPGSSGPLIWDTAADQENPFLWVAARRREVQSLCAALAERGIAPAAVLPSWAGLARAVGSAAHRPFNPGIVVNIGAQTSTLLAFRGAKLLVRTLPFGGNAVTASLAEALGLSFGEAERLKCGMPSGADSLRAPALSEATGALALRLEREVRRAWLGWKDFLGEAVPGGIALTGGGALLPGIGEAIERAIGVPVSCRTWGDEVDFGQTRRELPPGGVARLADLVGFAAGSTEPAARPNLFRPEFLAPPEGGARRRMCAKMGLGLALAAAFPAAAWMAAAARADASLARAAGEFAPWQARSAEARALAREIESLRREAGERHDLLRERAWWNGLFSDLQGRLAQVGDVWLERLKMEKIAAARIGSAEAEPPSLFPPGGVGEFSPERSGGTNLSRGLRLEGRLLDVGDPRARMGPEARRRIVDLLGRLKESPYVRSVESDQFDADQPGVLRFSLVLRLAEEPGR